MKNLLVSSAGSLAGLFVALTTVRASADNQYWCWLRAVPGDSASSITVDTNGDPIIVGPGSQAYRLDNYPSAPVWTEHPALYQPIAAVSEDSAGDFAALALSGDLYTSDSTWGLWNGLASGYVTNCLGSFAVLADGFGGGTEVGVPCGQSLIWMTNLFYSPFNQAFTNLPSGEAAAAVAGFSGEQSSGGDTLWAMAQDGTLYAWNGSSYGQQPGWNVTSISDHVVVGSGGSVYWWDDYAQDFLSNQVIHGNWTQTSWGPTPSGIQQIASNFTGALWAIDNNAGVYAASSCTHLTHDDRITANNNGGVFAHITLSAFQNGIFQMTPTIANHDQSTGYMYALACNIGTYAIGYAGHVDPDSFLNINGPGLDSPGTIGLNDEAITADWANISTMWQAGPQSGPNFTCSLSVSSTFQQEIDGDIHEFLAWLGNAELQQLGVNDPSMLTQCVAQSTNVVACTADVRGCSTPENSRTGDSSPCDYPDPSPGE